MKKALIILSSILGVTIIINVIFVVLNRQTPSSSVLHQDFATPTVTTSPQIPDNPTEQDIDSIIAALEKNSTTETQSNPTLTIPTGFHFPENATLTQKISLELDLPSLTPDPHTKRMNDLERDLLHSHLSQNYYYDPASQNIVADPNYKVQTSVIDFGLFDPPTLEIKKNENVLWFNQNTLTCQLRTDPKSPEHINQTIESQKSTMNTFTTAGIYIFYCQDHPENTQTIVVI